MKFQSICVQVLVGALALGSASCVPMGDCWPTVTPEIEFAPVVSDRSLPIVVAGASRIYEQDVPGVDQQGVPIAPRGLIPFGSEKPFWGNPYPTWYIAFLDTNGNNQLDPGELFGVDPKNPRPGTCDPYTVVIEIDSIRSVTQ